MDTYIIKYLKQDAEGYWKLNEEMVCAEGKGAHVEASDKFLECHKGEKVRILSVTYC